MGVELASLTAEVNTWLGNVSGSKKERLLSIPKIAIHSLTCEG
jgi:hypothetical protein